MEETISNTELEILRTKYKSGVRVELVKMNDFYDQTLKPGDYGYVIEVDDIGTIFIKWDCGKILGCCYNIDELSIV